MEWYKRLSHALNAPAELKNVFAFAFHAWCNVQEDKDAAQETCLQRYQPGGEEEMGSKLVMWKIMRNFQCYQSVVILQFCVDQLC